MIACKQGLNPRTLIGFAKQTIQKSGLKTFDKIEAVPREELELRRLTTARLRQKLDLEKYNNPSPLADGEISVKRLYISLRQNIGAPSVCIVRQGQTVTRGECIAEAPEASLGLPIHSPVDGKVLCVSKDTVTIESAERN